MGQDEEKTGLLSLEGPFSAAKAIALQRKWRGLVRFDRLGGPVRYVGGADMSLSRCGRYCVAGVVVLEMGSLAVMAESHAVLPLEVPYIPGLLSFREAPAVIEAAKGLAVKPDVLLIDGQGLAHPRRFGLACHVGVALDWRTIGCAKSRLVGSYREPGVKKGCRCRLMDGQEVIGTVLRSRTGVKCLYVSVGHRVDLAGAAGLVLKCCRRYRLPEPTRLAHQMVSRLRVEL